MDKIILSPGKYVQGVNVLAKIAGYVKDFGSKPMAIADDFVTGLVGETVSQSFLQNDSELILELFNGECSRPEIERLQDLCQSSGADVILGIGGGKTLDTAKAIGYYSKIPVVVVPTIASTDAPTSALTVIYTPEGEFSEYLMLPKNPDMVVMDTRVIAGAPSRLLVSGLGDALSTYFEARANKLSGNIIEANTYLSGIGFESSGLAAAHAIHNGLTKLEECHHLFHGEKVAFGTLTQLVLENAPLEEISEVISFCRSVGLPTCLTDMGVKVVTREKLLPVAETACAEGETIHNMPFEVTPEAVLAALLTADKLGGH